MKVFLWGYVLQWSTSWRDRVGGEVLADEGRRQKVLLRLTVSEANFNEWNISLRNNTYCWVWELQDDFKSPSLFIWSWDGNESGVSRGGGWKMLRGSELFKVDCAFHWKECGSGFLSGNLHPGQLRCHSATIDYKNSLCIGVWSIIDRWCVFSEAQYRLVQRNSGEREWSVAEHFK